MSFNKLKPAQAEILALLAEECGELVQAIGKALRHGLDSCHPLSPNGPNNLSNIEEECGDVLAAIDLLTYYTAAHSAVIESHKQDKLDRVGKYLHHAKDSL